MENDDTNSVIKIYLNVISPSWMDHIMRHVMYHITSLRYIHFNLVWDKDDHKMQKDIEDISNIAIMWFVGKVLIWKLSNIT